MNTSETGRLDVGHDIRTLQDDELDAVPGGWSWGLSQSGAGVTVPVVARRSFLESMAEDECGV
jgi:hypothetical protein